MSHTFFKKTFIAVDTDHNTLTIGDLSQLIQDLGFTKFLKKFGFDHGDIKRENVFHREILRDGKIKYFDTVKLTREFEYFIEDGHGKRYSPEHILVMFCETFPRLSKPLIKQYEKEATRGCWYYYRGSKSAWSGEKRYRNLKGFRSINRSHDEAILVGEKGIRKFKQYHLQPWTERHLRSDFRDRSWKRHRKTQYKDES